MKSWKETNASNNAYDYLIKIMMLGTPGVGKSCFVRRFADNTYSDRFISTIGADFKIKRGIIDGKECKLQVWDLAAQEGFRIQINPAHYRGAGAFIIAYDITNKESFTKVAESLHEIQRFGMEGVPVVLVGMKSDSPDAKRQVTYKEAIQYACDNNMGFIEASAKSDVNVDEAFILASQMAVWRIRNDNAPLKMVDSKIVDSTFVASDKNEIQTLVDSLDDSLVDCNYRVVDQDNATIMITPPKALKKPAFIQLLKQQPSFKAVQQNHEIIEQGTYGKKDFGLTFKKKQLSNNNNNNNSPVKKTSNTKPVKQQPVIKNESSAAPALKTVILGNSGTGKTALQSSFVGPNPLSTIGIDFINRTMPIGGINQKFQVWDLAPLAFRTYNLAWLRGTQIFIICYDITNQNSVDEIQSWIDLAQRYGKESAPILLVGTKSDLAQDRVISFENAQAFAQSHGLEYKEINALDAKSAEEVFLLAGHMALEANSAANEKNERNNNNNNNAPQDCFNGLLNYLNDKYEEVKHQQPTPQKPKLTTKWLRYERRLTHYSMVRDFMVNAMIDFDAGKKTAVAIKSELDAFLKSDTLPQIEGKKIGFMSGSTEIYLGLIRNLSTLPAKELVKQFKAAEERLSTMEQTHPIVYVSKNFEPRPGDAADIHKVGASSSSSSDENEDKNDSIYEKNGIFEL